jgi:hypothetical protein
MNERLSYIHSEIDPTPSVSEAYRGQYESSAITVQDFLNSIFDREVERLAEDSRAAVSSGEEDAIEISSDVVKDAKFVGALLVPGVVRPCLVWLEDGGISLEWRASGKILTVSIYGDGYIIWGGNFGKSGHARSIISPLRAESSQKISPAISYLLNCLDDHFKGADGITGSSSAQ